MEVRPAAFADIKRIVPFLVEANALAATSDVPVDEGEIRNTLQRAINQPGHQVFLSFDGDVLTGVLVGISNKIWFSKKRQVLDLVFYVAPEHRGHGYFLARRYLGWARKIKGAVEVYLGVTSGMDTDRAEQFYQGLGLERVGSVYRMGVTHVESGKENR